MPETLKEGNVFHGRLWLKNHVLAQGLYQGLLQRAPDAAGFNAWLAQLNAGVPAETAISGFLNSAEYKRRFGCDPSEQL